MSNVIFERGGLTVTESESLYQITRTSDGVVVATVVKIPINNGDDNTLVEGGMFEGVNQGKVKGIAILMANSGYGKVQS